MASETEMRLAIAIALLFSFGCEAPIRLTRVVCSGATELTEGHLYAWLKANLPTELNDVDPAALRQTLLQVLPFRDVRVERRWPESLTVEVVERKPYAMMLADDGTVAIVDRQGFLVSLRRDQELMLWDRPAIRGCELPERIDLATTCATAALGFINLIDHVRPSWLASLSEIRIVGEQVQVYLDDGMRIRFGRGPIEPQLEALARAWGLAQKNALPVRGIRIVDAERVVLQTYSELAKTGA